MSPLVTWLLVIWVALDIVIVLALWRMTRGGWRSPSRHEVVVTVDTPFGTGVLLPPVGSGGGSRVRAAHRRAVDTIGGAR